MADSEKLNNLIKWRGEYEKSLDTIESSIKDLTAKVKQGRQRRAALGYTLGDHLSDDEHRGEDACGIGFLERVENEIRSLKQRKNDHEKKLSDWSRIIDELTPAVVPAANCMVANAANVSVGPVPAARQMVKDIPWWDVSGPAGPRVDDDPWEEAKRLAREKKKFGIKDDDGFGFDWIDDTSSDEDESVDHAGGRRKKTCAQKKKTCAQKKKTCAQKKKTRAQKKKSRVQKKKTRAQKKKARVKNTK